MQYHFDATGDFLERQNEICILLETAEKVEDEKKATFLKLAVVSLVTKFQVYIESVLKEFIYEIKRNQVLYRDLPVYMQLNSIKMDINNNALVKLAKHGKLNLDTKQKIKDYISSIDFIINEEQLVDDNLKIRTSFPLGRTGRTELLELFKQIEGNENIFVDINGEERIDLNQLDSLLHIRHLIIHQDRFNQTDIRIKEYQQYMIEMAYYCDNYLNDTLIRFGVQLEPRG